MGDRKTLQEQTIKNNFLFAATMMVEDNCKGVIERALGIKVANVNVCYEKSIIYHPEYKGIRLDVIAKDENNTHFNVEMQVAKREVFKRARYYHSQIDMELLLSGIEYEELPDCYVIFICDFDPIGARKYRYTIFSSFRELQEQEYKDGAHTVFLSTKGKNDDDEPEELIKFLKFVNADLEDSKKDFKDAFVEKLQRTIAEIKSSREMGERYMLFEEMMRNEYRAGKTEGLAEGKAASILELLEDVGEVSDSLRNKISSITDIQLLTVLLKKAAKATSIEEFEKEIPAK